MNSATNLVDQAKNEVFGNGNVRQLSSLIGAGEGATRNAVGAAVPSMLSALSNLASSGGGAQKLQSALGRFDEEEIDKTTHMLADNPNVVQEQGGSLLNSLIPGNILSGIANSVSKFAGIGAGSIQKLLGYLAPVVLGAIASRFKGKPVNAQGLTSLFNEQKANVASAIPSGLSLADVPGMTTATNAARAAYDTGKAGYEATRQASSSALKWLVPVLVLAGAALLAYLLWPKSKSTPPDVPDVAKLTTDMTGNFKSATDALAGVTDAASAEAALPKIRELTNQFDGMKEMVGKLPEEGKAKVLELIRSNTGKLSDQFNRVLMIPGVGDKLRPALDGLADKVASIGGPSLGQFQLPSVDVTSLGSRISGQFSSLTDALTSVKDAATAEAAIPKLQEINTQLDATK